MRRRRRSRLRKRRARGAGFENAERFRYVVVKCKYIHSRNTFVSSVDRLVYSEPLFPPDTLSNVLEKAATGKTVPTKAEEQSFLEPLIDPYNYENNYAPPKQQMWSTHLGTHRPPPPPPPPPPPSQHAPRRSNLRVPYSFRAGTHQRVRPKDVRFRLPHRVQE